jgi:branched-chain amino acid transport system ATP-binding protein
VIAASRHGTGLGIADRAYVVESGQVAIHGPAKTLLADPRIKQAYLEL